MATNEIQGDLVGLFISTDGGTTKLEVVCAENSGVDGSRDVNSKRTKCGVIKGFGPASWTMTGSGVANTTPGTGKASAQTLIAAFQNETPLSIYLIHAVDDALYYREGAGQLSRYTETANTGDTVNFDFTFDIAGNLVIVSPGP
jgi:hypothetical protein